jgi:hypothetical protein
MMNILANRGNIGGFDGDPLDFGEGALEQEEYISVVGAVLIAGTTQWTCGPILMTWKVNILPPYVSRHLNPSFHYRSRHTEQNQSPPQPTSYPI